MSITSATPPSPPTRPPSLRPAIRRWGGGAAVRPPAPLRRALRGSTLLFGATMVVNLLNYGYAMVLGRLFGPEPYGAYASFMSLFLLLTLLPMTLQQVGARFAAAGESAIAVTSRQALSIGSLGATLLALFSGPLAQLLQLPQGWLIGLALALPCYALLGAVRGEAQGRQAFGTLGGNLVLEHGAKIGLTPLALLVAPLASGAVLATLLALPLTLAPLWRYLKSSTLRTVRRAAVRRYALPVLIGLSSQAVIVNSDVLMANALLPAEEAGLFAAIALIGRVVFYGSWAVGAAAFPLVAARHRTGHDHRGLLWAALGSVALVGLGVTSACALAPELVVRLLFGDAFVAGARLVVPYAFMTTLYALANIVSNHYLALGSFRAGILPLAGALAQVALVLFVHDTAVHIIVAQAVAKGGLLALLLVAAGLGWFSQGGNHVVR